MDNTWLAIGIFILLVGGVAGGLLIDIDNDGLNTVEEFQTGTDVLSADTDNDGLKDGEELERGTDPTKSDTDGDNLNDGAEVNEFGTDPKETDSDADGLDDFEEVNEYDSDPNSFDSDDDGLSDFDEVKEYGTDPSSADTDSDGLSDYEEVKEYGTYPSEADTDSDGLDDGEEIKTYQTNPTVSDSDYDGLEDGPEINTYETDPLSANSDGDSIEDGPEVNNYGTDPNDVDTDGDGLTDGEEIQKYGSDPLSKDTDNDGLEDAREVKIGTNISNPDTDGDGIPDGPEVNKEIFSEASPTHMDVFVELDWMNGEKPSSDQIDPVVEAYDDAPISNPDGSTGIDLHVKYDEEINKIDSIDYDGLRDITTDHFQNSDTGYHYGVAIEQTSEADLGGFQLPSAPGNAFAFKTDAKAGYYYPEGAISMMIMHELGHSVGLSNSDFEGIDSESYTYSEYSSSMNYNSEPGDVEYNTGKPFDDWKELAENIATPGYELGYQIPPDLND